MISELLIQNLIEDTRLTHNQVEGLKNIDLKGLKWKENKTSWSILEYMEHLNMYGDFYLPQIESQITKSTTKSDFEFKSGMLGNYFAKSMLPKDKLNKMKTFKDKNPLSSIIAK